MNRKRLVRIADENCQISSRFVSKVKSNNMKIANEKPSTFVDIDRITGSVALTSIELVSARESCSRLHGLPDENFLNAGLNK